jgi:uncharacterized membrane protein
MSSASCNKGRKAQFFYLILESFNWNILSHIVPV